MSEAVRVSEEEVLVVPAVIFSEVPRQTLVADDDDQLTRSIWRNARWMKRSEAEKDAGFRQIIPQVLLEQGEKVWGMERLAGSGEARLHHQWTATVGGHLNPVDLNGEPLGESILWSGLMRELQEELVVPEGSELEIGFQGWLVDDATPVSRVHVGAMFLARIVTLPAETQIAVRETEKLRGQWIAREDLGTIAWDTWSQTMVTWWNHA